jgi:predicted nucleic-acid-binding Zn-ribbon protein
MAFAARCFRFEGVQCGSTADVTKRSRVNLEVQLNPIACPRCSEQLEHLGTKRFHQGTNWGVLGELGEFFVKRERFDVYACPRCGRVEFYVDGIGEQHRPQ